MARFRKRRMEVCEARDESWLIRVIVLGFLGGSFLKLRWYSVGWIEGRCRIRWRSSPWKITGGRWFGFERVRGRVSSTNV